MGLFVVVPLLFSRSSEFFSESSSVQSDNPSDEDSLALIDAVYLRAASGSSSDAGSAFAVLAVWMAALEPLLVRI